MTYCRSSAHSWSAAAIALPLITLVQPALSDPLHKVGQAEAWQHEQSGWIFPKQVAEFERMLPPYEIDGTYDVGAEYEHVEKSGRTRATVHVYAKDSAAAEANFGAAKQKPRFGAAESHAHALAEEPCSIEVAVEVRCRKVTYVSDTDAEHSQLYFVESNDWIVNVRTTTTGNPAHTSALTDRFVSELNWNKLGTVPDLHAAR